jgi:hypothetical protein
MGYFDQGSDGGSLVVRPLVFPHPSSKFGVVVGATADVDDKEVVLVVLVKVICHIVDGVPVGFLEKTGSRVCHSDDATGYIS